MTEEAAALQGDTETAAGEATATAVNQNAGEQPPVGTEGETETAGAKETKAESEGQGETGAEGPEVEYTDFDYSKYPEGFSMDETATQAFKEIGKKLNLSQEHMQELVDFDAQRTAGVQETLADQHDTQVQQWRDTIEADPDLGGSHLEETKATVAKAVDLFGGEELRTFLDQIGIGDHPVMVRAWHAVGKAITEDSLITGKENRGPESDGSRFYPSMQQEH